MKKQLFIFLLILILFSIISAQENESQKVYQLDPFSECEFLRIKLDNFFIHLQNTPDSIGFIIYYEGKYSSKVYNEDLNRKKIPKTEKNKYLPRIGEINTHLQTMREQIKQRNFPSDKIWFVNGGFRETFEVEFWLVPKGAKLPKLTPTREIMEYRQGKPSWTCDKPF